MKLFLLGATGRTGGLILRQALQMGWQVHCLVRNKDKLLVHDPLMTVFEGNPNHLEELKPAMKGCHNVISVLNISRNSDFPWSPLCTPKTYLSDVMQNLIKACNVLGIKRVVLCSAWGVGETWHQVPFWFKATIKYSNIRFAYKDHERQEGLLEDTPLDWTIVRPVGLVNFKKQKAVTAKPPDKAPPGWLISRSDLALYFLETVTDPTNFKKKLTVSWA